ncbi:hypothetical protein [Hymenobacter busanensis]|uniref:hypothetical protein n=1 Tax=Hymenobacter busanensis TaxID=2607656 RepID=UPI001366A0BB|nr:hypothetical protein [Hymenobacter busanensis]QHJ05903.1 hypothetical protein GUY19_00770 [Hymenobacter busanensis]
MENDAITPERKLSKTITLTPTAHANLVALSKRLRAEHDRYVTASETITILLAAYEAAS